MSLRDLPGDAHRGHQAPLPSHFNLLLGPGVGWVTSQMSSAAPSTLQGWSRRPSSGENRPHHLLQKHRRDHLVVRTAGKITGTSLSHSQDVAPRTSACPPTPHLACFNPQQVRNRQVALSLYYYYFIIFRIVLVFINCFTVRKCQTFRCSPRSSVCAVLSCLQPPLRTE